MKKKLIKRISYAVVALTVGLVAASCSRDVDDSDSSTLNLNIPSQIFQNVGAQAVSNADLMNVIVNIKGPGMIRPVFYAWERHGFGQSVPPAFVIPEVPQGEDRLVQALAIYLDSTTNQQVFYYGDILTPIQGDQVPLAITVLSLAGVTGQGQIGGRYLDAGGSGPTGKVNIFYKPADKPRMIVHRSEIFAGWFNFFALKGQAFEYVLEDGSLFMGAPLGLDSANLPAEGASLLRMTTNSLYRDFGSGSEIYGAEEHLYGWFGPGVSTEQICYYNTGRAMANLFTDSGASTAANWLTDAGVTAGGSGTASLTDDSLCTIGGTRYDTYLSFDDQALAEHDRSLNFKGPFIMLDNGGNRESILASYTSGLNINIQYLPGVLTAGLNQRIDGADVYARELPGGATEAEKENFKQPGSDGVNCQGLSFIQHPFTLVHNEPYTTGEIVDIDGISFSSSGAFDAGNVQVIACPYRNLDKGKRYFSSAAIYRGGGGGGSADINFAVATSSPIESVGSHDILVNLSSAQGSNVTVDYATADMTANGGADYTAASGTLTFTPGQTVLTIPVAINDDATPEGNEDFQVILSNPAGAALGATTVHTTTIISDE